MNLGLVRGGFFFEKSFLPFLLKVLAFVGRRRPRCLTTSVLLRWTDASSQCTTLAMNGAPGLLSQEPQQRTMRSRSSTKAATGGHSCCSTHCKRSCCQECCADGHAAASKTNTQQQPTSASGHGQRAQRNAQLSPCELYSLARLGQRLSSPQEITDVLLQRLDVAQLTEHTFTVRVGLREAIAPPHAESMSEFMGVYAMARSQ